MIKWRSEKRKLADLKPAPYNPRQMSEKQAKDLRESLSKFNLATPIVINADNTVIGGNQRLKIMQEKGIKEIDVRVPDRQLTEKEEKELNLRLNKNLGEWDVNLLAKFSKDLLDNVGFDSDELDKIFHFDTGEKDPDKIPEERKTDIKLGDMFQVGERILLCGDATKTKDIEKVMKGDKARLCFTSPPYNMASNMYKDYADNLKREEFIKLHLTSIKALIPFLRGFIFWNVSYNKNARDEFLEILYRITKETELRFLELIVWDKGHALPINSREGLTRRYEDILLTGDPDSVQRDLELYCISTTERKAYFNKKTQKGISNYWRIDTSGAQLENIKACFPVALVEKALLLMTKRGEICVDFFGGSGTTLIGCQRSGRYCRTMEITPVYCQVILDRWEAFTGKKAKRIS